VKILHVATHGSVTRGGAVQMVRLARALASRGHRVKAVFNREKREEIEGISILEERGVEVEALPLEPMRLKNLVSFRKMVLREGFQVVHAHRDPALRFAYFSLWNTGVPLVAQRGTTYRPKGVIPFILRRGGVAGIVAVAHAVKTSLVRVGIPEGKVKVVYGSVDIHRFHPALGGTRVREEVKIPIRAPVVGMVAALVGKKGYPLFLKACQDVAAVFSGLRLLMVGAGRPSKYGKEAAPLKERAIFVGHREKVEEYMAAMDVVVCASTKGEGLTGSLREAMALGKPVVSTAVSGNPEAVIPGKTGLLVPVGDPASMARAILVILSNPCLARRLGNNGRRWASRVFPDDRRVGIMEELYRELVE